MAQLFSFGKKMKPKVPWWGAGLVGAFTLSLATVAKILLAFRAIAAGKESIGELVSFVGVIFAIGFACGLCVWGTLPLAKKGWLGLAATGFIAMNFFFLACMLVFDPDLLSPDPMRAAPMFALASVLGPLAGVVVGRSLRDEWVKAKAEFEKRLDE